jgi:D-sedoheptulose 7-phosphate isomerase
MDLVLIKEIIMKNSTKKIIERFKEENFKLDKLEIENAIQIIIDTYKNKKKLLVCGNGGSAADSLHIVGELMKGFLLERKLDKVDQNKIKKMFPDEASYFIENLQKTLPTISLVNEISLITAFSNDKASDLIFAQQVFGYGEEGDVLFAISTSGNSKNILNAVKIAKVKKMKVILLTGFNGGKIKEFTDICLIAPDKRTFKIQEYHLPIYHVICAAVENEIFGE